MPFSSRIPFRLLAVALLAAGIFTGLRGAPAAGGAAPGGLPDQPDLGVAYLQFTPRYPAYAPQYPDDVPQPTDPATGKIIPPEQARKIRRTPRSRERMTVTARVVNHGGAPAGPFEYRWLVDGKRVAGGRHSGLATDCTAGETSVPWVLQKRTYRAALLKPDATAEFQYSWRYSSRPRMIRFEVVPSEPEISDDNNTREEYTDSLAFVILVRRTNYNRFARVANALGDRDPSYSFEDWVQHHFDLMRRKFRESAYPSAPRGILEHVRIDMIQVLADDEPRDTLNEIKALNGWDGYWDFHNYQDADKDAKAPDWALIHELGHQLGLIDLYMLDTVPSDNFVRDPDTGEPVLIGHTLPIRGMMRAHGDVPFSEHSALALNAQRGRRRGYYGDYLYAIPAQNRLLILDNNDRPVPGAAVTVWQTRDRKVVDPPVFQGETGADGTLALPNRPAPHVTTEEGFTQRDNPFGKIHVVGTNGVFFIRAAARGQVDYRWLPITTFNIAYGRGERQLATHRIPTSIPADDRVVAPRNVSARVRRQGDRTAVRVAWEKSPNPDVVGYFVYRGDYPTYDYAKIATVSLLRDEHTDTGKDGQLPSHLARYAVTAVTRDGRESAHAPAQGVVVWGRPWGVAVTAEGWVLVADPTRQSPLLLRGDLSALGNLGSDGNQLHPYDAAVAANGDVVLTDMPDGYSQNRRNGLTRYRRDGTVLWSLNPEKGAKPGEFREPHGVKVAPNGELLVADTGNGRVQVLDGDGKFRREFGVGQLRAPEKVIVNAAGEYLVADSAGDRVAVFGPDGQYRRQLGGLSAPRYLCLDPSGRLFVSGEGAIAVFRPDGTLLKRLTAVGGSPLVEPAGLAVHGEYLIVADPGVRTVRRAPLRELLEN